MDIGKKLKAYRTLRGYSQEELASFSGINEKYYGEIERNKSCPTIKKLLKICEALNIDIIELFLYSSDYNKHKFFLNQQIIHIILDCLKNDIDVHFNRNVIMEGCKNSIWYNGFIGSMNFDEFEFQLFAVGNIKGELFYNGKKC